MTSIVLTIERGEDEDWRELTVTITAEWHPYRRATMTDPAEGGAFEDVTATVDGEPFHMTRDEVPRAIEALQQALEAASELREQDREGI